MNNLRLKDYPRPTKLSTNQQVLLSLHGRPEHLSQEAYQNLRREKARIINAVRPRTDQKKHKVPAFGTAAMTNKNATVQRRQYVKLPNGRTRLIEHRFDNN